MNGPAYTTLAELVADKADTNPDFQVLTFVTVGDDGQLQDETRTYRQLNEHGQALAGGLSHLGVAQGDNLAVMMNNHPEFLETMVAAGILGAAFVPIDPRAMGAKLSYMLDFTDCQGVVCADYALASLLAVVADCSQLKWLLVVPTTDEFYPPAAQPAVKDYRDFVITEGQPVTPVAQDRRIPCS